jgi:menaquinone-dependent protoporphyrinogen IX oxidase
MPKTVVVYKSNYGSTEKYARWIADDTKADLFRSNQIKPSKLIDYDTIVYCGGLYAGGMLGFSLIKKNYEKLKNKKMIVVAVGATLKSTAECEDVKKQNLTPQMLDKVHFFLLRGGLNYAKMSLIHKTMLYLLVQSAK